MDDAKSSPKYMSDAKYGMELEGESGKHERQYMSQCDTMNFVEKKGEKMSKNMNKFQIIMYSCNTAKTHDTAVTGCGVALGSDF